MKYFPPERDLGKLPRDFIVNLLYTLGDEEFMEWVNSRIEARKKKVEEKKNSYIDIAPEFKQAFLDWNMVAGTSLIPISEP